MFRTVMRGLAAGAAGTTALNAATYADMAVRGRPTSSIPERSVEKFASDAGVEIPGDGEARQNRVSGIGALLGIGTGLSAGLAASALGPLVRRVPFPVAAVLVGGLAMAGSDVPMTRLGLTDPSDWSTSDWLADALPHLAYGVGTAWTLRALSR
jgi:drug/metabolite transporter (DMT)-like permease